MNWMNKLEKKFGRYAIKNLMLYITILYAIGFLIVEFAPMFYLQYLSMDVNAILHGQIWRLVTFIIFPPSTNVWFILITLYLYYSIGRELEYVWGAFRFNLYFFTGVLLHIIAAFITYFVFDVSFLTLMGASYLNLSLFFAYATIYPNQQFLMFMVIPVKAKYLAWIDAAYFGYTILQAFLPAYGGSGAGYLYKANALAAFVSILNFLIFFFSSRKMKRFSPREVKRKQTYHRAVREGQKKQMNYNGAKHRCAICGRTELDDDRLEFRYCSKCNGNYEYCQDHLFTHEHVK